MKAYDLNAEWRRQLEVSRADVLREAERRRHVEVTT
jgi:hypothetical protein